MTPAPPPLSDTEWRHLLSVLQLDSLKGDKQSKDLFEKLSTTIPSEREQVLDELMKYINEIYPIPPETGDYLYPSRKGRREVCDQLRDKIAELRTTPEAHP